MRDSQNQEIFTTTRVPVSMKDIEKMYGRGKYSLLNASPSCEVDNIHDHAYVSLKSVVNNFLAFDHTRDNNTTNMISTDRLEISKEETEIRMSMQNSQEDNVEPLILFINLWSDDFEVNITRKMGDSAWIMIATLSLRLSNESLVKKTYVIALGFKSKSHDGIHELVFTELQNLAIPTPRFYGKMKKAVPVIDRVLSVLAERPERSALTGIMSNTGTHRRHWIYSGNINKKPIP